VLYCEYLGGVVVCLETLLGASKSCLDGCCAGSDTGKTIPNKNKNYLSMTIKANQNNKTNKLVSSCANQSDKRRIILSATVYMYIQYTYTVTTKEVIHVRYI